MAAEMSNVAALRKFFNDDPNSRKLTMTELKELTAEDREELGKLAKIELGYK